MKKHLLRVAALLVVGLMLLPAMLACADRGTPMLSLTVEGKTYTYSKNLYELQLSIVKGTLSQYGGPTVNGHTALQNAFWDSIDEINGKTQKLDDYYRETVLAECRHQLIGLYLFDYYGLTLSESKKEEIDDYLNEFILSDGDGSKNKLNSILADYGINYEMLEEHCINAAKLSAVRDHLYSLLGNNIKQNYLKDNYIHFDQLFLANYDYVYVTDANGDEVYYNESDKSICYKVTEHWEYGKDGSKVYYTSADKDHISYDTEKGIRSYKLGENGSYAVEKMTDDELKALETRAELLYDQLKGVEYKDFEAAIEREADGDEFEDGYYLNKNDVEYFSSTADTMYLSTIVEKLSDAKAGEVILVESTMGYHIVMKLDPTDRAYELEANQAWFETAGSTSFAYALTEEIFLSECKKYDAMVTLDQAVYAETPSMKQVNPNYYFFEKRS